MEKNMTILKSLCVLSTLAIGTTGYASDSDNEPDVPCNHSDECGYLQVCIDSVCTYPEGLCLPAGAVMPFYLQACPAGWVMADGRAGTPDLRNMFVRGVDPETRVLGSFEDDALGAHGHVYTDWSNTCSSRDDGSNKSSGFCRRSGIFEAEKMTSDAGGLETRPKNVALLYCIKL